jgi:hypothetical protein
MLLGYVIFLPHRTYVFSLTTERQRSVNDKSVREVVDKSPRLESCSLKNCLTGTIIRYLLSGLKSVRNELRRS